MARELEQPQAFVNGLYYEANTGLVQVPGSTPSAIQSPSRLREGLGEGRPTNAPPGHAPPPTPPASGRGAEEKGGKGKAYPPPFAYERRRPAALGQLPRPRGSPLGTMPETHAGRKNFLRGNL